MEIGSLAFSLSIVIACLDWVLSVELVIYIYIFLRDTIQVNGVFGLFPVSVILCVICS